MLAIGAWHAQYCSVVHGNCYVDEGDSPQEISNKLCRVTEKVTGQPNFILIIQNDTVTQTFLSGWHFDREYDRQE